MAKNPNRNYKVKVAAPAKKAKFDLPKTHICTSDFGILKSIDCRLYVPGDDFKFKVSQFTRLMPMPVPTYGDIKSITRCFVVPINTVMNNFGDFISKNYTSVAPGQASYNSPSVPYFFAYNLVELFCPGMYPDLQFTSPFVAETPTIVQPGATGYDVIIRARSGNNYIGVKFSYLGRKVVSWLHGLGLNWQWSLRSEESQTFSALPILCWWKFYLDWIVPSRFRQDFAFQQSFLGLNYNTTNSDILNIVLDSDYEKFAKLFTPVSCYYSDDYFSNAFITPYGLEQSSPYGSYSYNDSGQLYDTNPYSYPSAEVDTSISPQGGFFPGPQLSTVDSDGNNLINYFSLQSLGVLQDLVNRGKLAGTKIQDYLFTTYGIRPNDDVLHLSKYIGSHRNTIQIGDIKATATTDTQSSGTTYLGQFAGTAAGGNSDTFEFGNYEEHSYIFITNELSIRPSYTQGVHQEWKALTRFDFYDPNWDGVGVTAIPFGELCSDCSYERGIDESQIPAPDEVFGYKPNYAEFKNSFDIISGDFRCGRLNSGLDSWFLNRQINKEYLDSVGSYINRKFCEQVSDSNNYDRIFQIANNNTDHFYSVFQIDCTAYRHMISLQDALETEAKDDGEGHKEVDVDFQGTVNS